MLQFIEDLKSLFNPLDTTSIEVNSLTTEQKFKYRFQFIKVFLYFGVISVCYLGYIVYLIRALFVENSPFFHIFLIVIGTWVYADLLSSFNQDIYDIRYRIFKREKKNLAQSAQPTNQGEQ